MDPEIKGQVRFLDPASWWKLAGKALELETAAELRTLVKEAFPVAGLNGLKTNTKNSRKILNDYERSFLC